MRAGAQLLRVGPQVIPPFSMSSFRAASTSFLAIVLAACSSGQPATSADSTTAAAAANGVAYAYNRVPLDTAHAAGAIIDSVFPMPEMIRRFRDGLPGLTSLQDGPESRQALVAQFITALATSNKATLGRLTLSRAEYAYLYFPNTPDASRENGLTPQRGWDQITRASEKGIGRALTRIGGKPITLESLHCPASPRTASPMRLHSGCTLTLGLADGTTFDGRLFGSIIEYAGRFKFVGYANDM